MLRPDLFSLNGINSIYRNIVHVLIQASLRTNSKQSQSTNIKKHWWNNDLTSYKNECVKCHKNWLSANKPNSGSIYLERKIARQKYRKALSNCKTAKCNAISDKMQNDLLGCRKQKFWKFWKSYFNSKSNTNKMTVNKCNNDQDIANCLATGFKDACTPNDQKKHEEFKNEYLLKASNCCDTDSDFEINVENLNKAIYQIENNKASGFDNLSIEHIKFAHPSLVVILFHLLNLFLFTGYVPDDFGKGLTTAIPKFKGHKKDVGTDDFRGITVNSVLSKIFEYCLFDQVNIIKTSNRQFGFKKGTSCRNSIHSVRKIIHYFNSRKTTVNLGVVDLKKAFDKVNIYGVLGVLLDKKLNFNIIKVLENWLTKNNTIVKWNNATSKMVELKAGVRQGGILSPLLFNIYVDNVLAVLEKSNYGCFVGFECQNSFMYADDLILISASVKDLQMLFNTCSNVFKDLDLPINISKCCCMRIGPRFNLLCNNIVLNNQEILWVKEITFLGIVICNTKHFSCSWSNAKSKFFLSSNIIFGRLGTKAHVNVLMKLLFTHGVQNLLYGVAATSLNKADIANLSFAFNKMIIKIFNTTDVGNINSCLYYCGYLNFERLYDMQRLSFLYELVNQNIIVRGNALDCIDFIDFDKLLAKYELSQFDNVSKIKYKVWHKFSEQVV